MIKKSTMILGLLILFVCVFQVSGKRVRLSGQFGEDQLLLPRQIAVSGNEIFILDEYGNMTSGDEKIKVYSLDGKLKMEFGSGGEGPGEYGEARALHIENGKIYVLDGRRRKIHQFSLKNKKHLESRSLISGARNIFYTTPGDFLVTRGGELVYNAGRSIKGQKLISRLVEAPDRKYEKKVDFFDCIPVYNSIKELFSMSQEEMSRPGYIRKRYLNHGYIAAAGDRVYFTYWLVNQVVEFSLDGEILNRYTIQLDSLEKMVKLTKLGRFNTIERRLNYDLIVHEGQVFVLSRDKNGDSVVFQLENGAFKEKYRMKEKLFSFDISGDRLYGIERDESLGLIYNLK